MNIKHVPNILSVIRILLVPVFILLFTKERIGTAIAVFLLAGLTDILDGYIARRFNCTSVAGKILDPLADKLMQFSAFICLYTARLIPLWMPVVYFLKELLTLIVALVVLKSKHFVVKSNAFGKGATVIVFAAVYVIAVFGKYMSDLAISLICLAVCLYFVFSCVMYARAMTQFKGQKKHDRIS